MSNHELLAAGFIPGDAQATLLQRYTILDYYNAADKAALLAQAARVRCLVATSHAPIDAALLDSLPALEQVSIYGMGYERLDVAPLRRRGIRLTNTPDVNVSDVADLGMAMILATVRRMTLADRFVREGRTARESLLFAHSVRGMTLGIAGLGRIGREVARRAEAFGMDVIYHNRHLRNDVPYRYVGSLRELAGEADVLLLSTPGGAGTQRMVNADILRALGSEGTLINIGRGTLVDEAALVAALQDGTIAAAGLDVFEDMARPHPGLLELDNVVLSPHRGSATFEARGAMARLFVANVDAFFRGETPPSVVTL
ncbi:MAG TPA: 2-hydroxyacid dehydrogenase [Candidatus Acidoferrum sp.]|nr:2-hydroxyacid dehydrogenase [Candidatus Acidoferrum sp.]